jgi:hypothetical protein
MVIGMDLALQTYDSVTFTQGTVLASLKELDGAHESLFSAASHLETLAEQLRLFLLHIS